MSESSKNHKAETADKKKISDRKTLRVLDRLSHNHRITVFTTVFFFIFCGLGTWQMQRAEEKRQLLEASEIQKVQIPKTLVQLSAEKFGESTILQGKFYKPYTVFLDNRTRDGRVGYEVVQLFCDAQRCAWVNRGWLAHKGRDFPNISTPSRGVYTSGLSHHPVAHSGIVDNVGQTENSAETKNQWPGLLQWLDIKALNTKISGRISKPIISQSIRLLPESEYAFHAKWPDSGMTVEKHLGYAGQWFALALAAILLQFFANSDGMYHWRHWRMRMKWWRYNEDMGKKK